MSRFRLSAFAATALLTIATPLRASTPGRAMAAFERVAQVYLARSSEADLDLLTPTGIAVRVRADRGLLSRLAEIEPAQLSRDAQVDAALLANALRYEIWRYQVLREQDWDVQRDEDILRDALSTLAGVDGQTWGTRLLAATPRLERLPEVLGAVRAQVAPARTPAVQAALVAQQSRALLETSLAPLLAHRDTLSATDRLRFDTATVKAREAYADYERWLNRLASHGRGDFRLGARLYDAKVRFEFGAELSRTRLERAARRATYDIRAKMYAIVRTLPEFRAQAAARSAGDASGRDQQETAIEAGLSLVEARHPSRSGFIDAIKADLASATAFVKARQIVTVPERPLDVVEMPPDLRGVVPAFFMDQGDRGVFAVSPIPTDWSAAKAEDYLRAHNDLYLQNLTVHEAMPGHALQSMHLEGTSPLRRALGVRVFAEGWAVYAQRMMVEEGYLNHDPLYALSELNWRLYMTCNALLDIGVQTRGMSHDEGIRLLTRGCFEPRSSAEAQWRRATYTSAQLLTYFVGYTEMSALRNEVERRRGAAFDLKAYHDEVLAHGMPPIRFVRELMLGEPIR